MTTRRTFLRQTAAALAVWGAPRLRPAVARAAAAGNWPIGVFEKIFEGLTYDELADAIAEIGADGVEATIRPMGHIEPAAAADEVPRMAEALAKRGKRIVIAATQIRTVDSPHAEALLRVFQEVDVTHYRMGYYYYDLQRPMRNQVAEFAAQARELAALNADHGIQALYQNHAGPRYLGSLGWDLAELLDGIDPSAIGVALDLRHLRADTGTSWPAAVAALKPHVRSIYIKDATWKGPRGDDLEDVPLDHGFVNRKLFDAVREGLPPMPLCLHVEHLGYRVFEKHEIPAAIKAHQEDLAVIRRWLEA